MSWPALQNVASCDLLDFVNVNEQGGIKVDLKLAKRLGLGHLIKQLRINKDGIQDIELEANRREKGTQREKGTSMISTVTETKEPRGHARKRLMKTA